MADKRKTKLTSLSSGRRSTLLKLEKSLKEGAPSGGPLMGSVRPKAALRTPTGENQQLYDRIHEGLRKPLSSDPLVGPGRNYSTPPSQTEIQYDKGVDYNAPTSD